MDLLLSLAEINFGIRFPEICFEKIINFELSSLIYIKIKELDYLLENQHFLIDYKQKNSIILMKNFVEMLHARYSFVIVVSNDFLFLKQTPFGHFCCNGF